MDCRKGTVRKGLEPASSDPRYANSRRRAVAPGVRILVTRLCSGIRSRELPCVRVWELWLSLKNGMRVDELLVSRKPGQQSTLKLTKRMR